MKIERNLNLVVPMQSESLGTYYVYSTPISREIFELYYLELGKVFSQCFDSANESHLVLSAPQLAYPALKAIAKKNGTWEGNCGVEAGLVNEIKRLTYILHCGENGWDTLPLDTIIRRNLIDDDDVADILSSVIFFTSMCKVAPKALRESFLKMAGTLRNWELTYLDCMAYRNSLATLINGESSGVTEAPSSIIA